ncbi:acetate kinase [Proteiniclasticum sp. QWL-01]|uniref:acetate/propionate family kinase n=1 Tax=Proteiniclasticum sp. QWL-01 TaxID=3036945 RepID=UPI0024117F5E|nr:acetate kinase [Proteiniclasticum sp. QWL-01]WFF74240.1 acetate kinase [Proteiniclasticum sp. QWL-01]
MKVLVINAGSSSLKYQLYDMSNEAVLAKGLVERIGIEGSLLTHRPEGKDKHVIETEMPDHKIAIQLVLDALVDPVVGVIKNVDEITAVGHRIVHGGEKYSSSVLLDDQLMEELKEVSKLAPLHNPPALIGIRACRELMPHTPMTAVFDTSFHQTMDPVAYMYAIPYELYESDKIRRYGFHGTSHKYVANRAAEMLNRNIEDMKIVTCHLGNGSSVTAVKHGKAIDTSMGFTPLAGLVMGTRTGDMDPAIVTYLMSEKGWDAKAVDNLMNKKSGVLGVSGVSSDFRDLEKAAAEGNKRAQLALDMFHYRVRKYIGSYAAAMGGIDAIVFTAGLGENSPMAREEILKGLEFLGFEVDLAKDNVRGKEVIFSSDNSRVKLMVIPTNEELMIARDTKVLVQEAKH